MSGEKDLRAELRRRIADARSEVAARIEAGDPYTDGAELDADLFEASADEIDRLTAEVERLRGLLASDVSWLVGWAGYHAAFEKDGAFARIAAIGDEITRALAPATPEDEG